MTKQPLSLQEFLNRLKKVDVLALLEKARSINIEDIKSIKFSDIKKIKDSQFFYPFLGLSFAGLISIFFLIPAYKDLRQKINTSRKYNLEESSINSVRENLNRKITIKTAFDKRMPEIRSLVLTYESLIKLTNLLEDAASKTSTNINLFEPVNYNKIQSCLTVKDNQMRSNANNRFNQKTGRNAQASYQSTLNQNPIPFSNNSVDNTSEFEEKALLNNLPIAKLTNIFRTIPNSANRRFSPNYFDLQLTGNYINILDFLRVIQEYKATVVPVCFSPKSSEETQLSLIMDQLGSSGEVNVRLVLNVPTR